MISAEQTSIDDGFTVAGGRTALAAGLDAAQTVLATARNRLGAALEEAGGVAKGETAGAEAFDAHQFAVHGFAWMATYVEALTQTLAWVDRLADGGRLGALESLIAQAAFGEYLGQIAGGIQISQGETVRPADLGLDRQDLRPLDAPGPRALMEGGNSIGVRRRIAALITDGQFGDWGLDDVTHDLVRDQFHRFANERIAPHANDWHLDNALIPDELLDEMAGLGIFGLTIPENYGGLDMGRGALCIVTEELSRGYLGAGSLPTRTEIAAELIRNSGTEDQKSRFLPGIASGEIIPTASFTEPDTGSDLGSLTTRATLAGDVYRVTGQKTWVTHGARSDLMTLLVRTDPDQPGWRGLSMMLAVKPRGTDDDSFPAPGMNGTEIEVLGYRGMREYEISFDGFAVDSRNLLGGSEGAGFKQLMQTFEAARIQTAARANGVAQNALELALAYAHERRQFSKPIAQFDRIAGRIGWMATEIMVSRQLTFFAARQKDQGRRCDAEAGMAKLLAARAAWMAADSAVQIHGGNGYALEFPVSRLLVDARILNIFEGAAEIQAHVIARALLAGRN